MRRLLAALTASLVGVVGFPTPASAMTQDTYESRIVWRINQQRGDLPHLVPSRCVDRYAERVASQMQYPLRHADLGAMMNECGAFAAGECLALIGSNPYHTVQAWMHSPEHRKVLMRDYYHRIGVASVKWGPYWLTVVRVTDRSN